MKKTKYEILNLMLEDMKNQSSLYKPTLFWEKGSAEIIEELEIGKVENFRSLVLPRSFFVPSYAYPEYLSNKDIYSGLKDHLNNITENINLKIRLNSLLSGEMLAFSDYKTLLLSNIDKKPYLDKVSESMVGNPLEQYTFDGRNFSRSFLNYLLGLSFLKQHVDTSKINTVMEIGGGFGTLGEILLGEEKNENIFYINIDIPPVGFISGYYLREVFGKNCVANYADLKNENSLDIEILKKQYRAINICSWQIEKLKGTIDLFVNFISFQEMEPEVVKNYCKYIRKLSPKYILLRNMKEGKRKKSDGAIYGVDTPILGTDYNTFLPEYELLKTDTKLFGFKTEDGFHSQLRLYIRK